MSQYPDLTYRSDVFAEAVILTHTNLKEAAMALRSQDAGIGELERISKLLIVANKLIKNEIWNPEALSKTVSALIEETRHQINWCKLDL